ncbi:uncharacterized protein FA14DRAFT_8558 [Meira miltonrushii]|uniref:ARID domain-containing protein n=1 Tax=Meira miltonrushii TaxID=1280837 RepID=A0A316VH64_9BASI|nr:uncharacterized protein FA14DRAFT_8558 [Meira miltonrushii]PWN36997.1 hypothetical protein FA14DRAFT_8558 [Meira miltonrushii]
MNAFGSGQPAGGVVGGGGQQGQQQQGPNQSQTQQLLAQMQMMAAAQQQQQQQQSQQPPANPQQPNGTSNGMMSTSQIPPQQLQQLQQNPMQMLQVVTGQINNLQRQWQTVQAQPESQQKMEAAQQLAAQMKKMKAFHSQTLQILQRQQQSQGQQNQNQSPAPQQQPQQNQQGMTPAAAPTPGPGPQSASTPQSGGNTGGSGGPAGEAASPAHNAQLAALQAFAQQQRMQAMHQQPSQQSSGQAQQNAPQPGGVQQTPQLKADLLNAVRSFMASKGTPLPHDLPTTFSAPGRGIAPGSTNGETKTIDMQMLFQTVVQFGGSSRIEARQNGWVILAAQLGLAVAPIPPNHQPGQGEVDSNGLPLPSFVAPRLAQFYKERFSSFEEFWLAKMKGQSGQQGQQQQQQQGQNAPGAVTNDANNASAGANGANAGQNNGSGMPDNQMANVTPQLAQESAKKAQELQAQLPQQMQQLQEMVKAGKMNQQQASQRFMYIQNAARMAAQIAAAQAQAVSSSGQNGEQQQMKPAVSQAQSQPSTSSVPTPAPAIASTPLQQNANNDSKKPPKRSRKSSTKQSNESEVKPEPVASTSEPSMNGISTAAPSIGLPPNTAHIQAANVQAQQAARMLHQGITNPAQQIGAFTAIRSAQVQQMQGNPSSSEIASVSQALAQVYARVLTQAQNAGQPLQVAAPVAFAAAQQESNKFPQIKPQAVQDIKDVQSTNTLDPGQAGPSSSRPTSSAGPVAIPSVGTTSTAPAEPVKPSKYKIEYLPIRRDVSSFGGWDLDSVEAQIGPILAGRGRFPRSVRELGTVDIEGLIMSLRSRVEIEVTYALNALFILTAGVQAPGFNLLLSLCEDLSDELLDILEEAAFGRLGLSEEEHFVEEDDDDDGFVEPIAMPKRPLTHGEWIIGVLEDEDKNKIHIQRKRKVSNGHLIRTNGVHDSLNEMALMSDDVDDNIEDARNVHENGSVVETEELEERDSHEEDKDVYEDIPTTYYSKIARERDLQRQADTAIVIIEILLNLSVVPENHHFLNNEPKFYTLLMNIVAAVDHEEIARRREDEKGRPETSGIFDTQKDEAPKHSTVFTASEALRVRKDILGIIGSLAGETSILTNLDSITLSNLFDFLASFVYDASEIEQLHGLVYREMPIGPPIRATPQNPHPPPQPTAMQPFTRKVPQHADLALEAFSSLGQPDVNRKILGDTIEEDRLIKLGEALIKLLPVSDMDFHMLKTEARLAFCERIAMTLFDIAYMGSGSVKRRLRHSPGTKGIIFRCIKRLMRIHKDFSQNPFSVLTRRLVETLRLLSDGENMFNRAPLLGFGMEGNSLASKTNTASNSQRFAVNGAMNGDTDRQQDDGNLLIEDEEAVVELMTVEGIDPTIISELEKML